MPRVQGITLEQDDLKFAGPIHGFTRTNARTAVSRIKKFVDDNEDGDLRLLAPGLKKAEDIMKRG